MSENENALNHIKKLIEDLNRNLPVTINVDDIDYASYSYVVRVSIVDEKRKIEFDRSIIDDLEVALAKYKGTKYFNTLESNVKFTIYIELGKEGLLDSFDISRELVNDKREWIKDYRVNTRFRPEFANILYNGLKGLRNFFDSLIEEHKSKKIDYSEIEENKDWVQTLIDYYKDKGHLNDTGVGTKNLQFLKAAAIKEIMDLEKMRKSEKRPTTLKALDKKIYEIVTELRKDPFLEIDLPVFIRDIAESLEDKRTE